MRTLSTWISPAAILLSANFTCLAYGEDAKQPAPAAQADAAPAPHVEAPVVRLRHGVFKYSSYPAAWTSAQSTNRPILVFATSSNCPHCVRMVGETFQAAPIRGYVNESFETVYVNRAEQPELAAKLKIRWYPTTLVVGPDNHVIDVIEGYVDAKTFAQRLQTSVATHQAATQKR
jgi:hypothetical protein